MPRNPKTELKGQILGLLKKVPFPLSTAKIAETLNVSWNTAEKYCIELGEEGKLRRSRKGKNSYWGVKIG